MKANALPINPNFSASMGLGRPNHVLNFPIISMFHEAPIMRPYARIVGPMKINTAIARASGLWDDSISGIISR